MFSGSYGRGRDRNKLIKPLISPMIIVSVTITSTAKPALAANVATTNKQKVKKIARPIKVAIKVNLLPCLY